MVPAAGSAPLPAGAGVPTAATMLLMKAVRVKLKTWSQVTTGSWAPLHTDGGAGGPSVPMISE